MGARGGEGGWWAGQREWRWEPGISGCRGVEELLASRARFWIQVSSWPHCQCSLTPPLPYPTGPNTRANTAWVSGSASACAACRPAPPAAPPSAKSSAAALTPCFTRASFTRGCLWSMTVSPAVCGDTDVWGAEVRGPKACPVTPVLSAGLPLTPSGSWRQPCRHYSPVEPPARH